MAREEDRFRSQNWNCYEDAPASMQDPEARAMNLDAASAITVTFLREGINIVDAAYEAQRYLGWKPTDEVTTEIMNGLTTGQAIRREQVARRLRERLG